MPGLAPSGLGAALSCLAACAPRIAAAHAAAESASGADVGDYAVFAVLLLAAIAYAAGLAKLWRRSATGRRASLMRAAAFGCGLLTLWVALISPLDRWGSQSFALHMIQHELLMLVAAPLLVAGRPLPIFLWCCGGASRAILARLPNSAVRAIWVALLSPPLAWTLHALSLWLWHVPAFFDAVLRNSPLHDLQHLTFLGAALAFWAALFETRRPEQQGGAVLYLFTTTVHTSVLGALITFAARPWYASYLQTAPTGGLSALEDQQLGGLIMWVPGSLVYVAVALVLLVRWIRASDRALSFRESRPAG